LPAADLLQAEAVIAAIVYGETRAQALANLKTWLVRATLRRDEVAGLLPALEALRTLRKDLSRTDDRARARRTTVRVLAKASELSQRRLPRTRMTRDYRVPAWCAFRRARWTMAAELRERLEGFAENGSGGADARAMVAAEVAAIESYARHIGLLRGPGERDDPDVLLRVVVCVLAAIGLTGAEMAAWWHHAWPTLPRRRRENLARVAVGRSSLRPALERVREWLFDPQPGDVGPWHPAHLERAIDRLDDAIGRCEAKNTAMVLRAAGPARIS
jgi:hypothetical protein